MPLHADVYQTRGEVLQDFPSKALAAYLLDYDNQQQEKCVAVVIGLHSA